MEKKMIMVNNEDYVDRRLNLDKLMAWTGTSEVVGDFH